MKRRALEILRLKQVRILVDFQVPPEAIAALGKGFVLEPQLDNEETRLDARRVTNKIATKGKKLSLATQEDQEDGSSNKDEEPNLTTEVVPEKLRITNYHKSFFEVEDEWAKSSLEVMDLMMNTIIKPTSNSKKKLCNMSTLEARGHSVPRMEKNHDLVLNQCQDLLFSYNQSCRELSGLSIKRKFS